MRRSVALALAVVVVAGCGGPTKAEYIEKADPICRRSAREFERVKPPADRTDPDAVVRYFRRLQAVAEKRLVALRSIKPAYEFRREYAAFLAVQGRYVEHVGKLVAATEAQDAERGFRLLQALPRLESELSTKANAAGLTSCTA